MVSVVCLQWLGIYSVAGLVLRKPWAYPYFHVGLARSFLIKLLIHLCHLGFFIICCAVHPTVYELLMSYIQNHWDLPAQSNLASVNLLNAND
jgi:hypothetical protein